MSTRTSTEKSLLAGSVSRGEGADDRFRDKLGHGAAELGDLPNTARRDERVGWRAHQVDRLDVGGESLVQVIHLELPLEVGDRTQTFHERARALVAGELDDEIRERQH